MTDSKFDSPADIEQVLSLARESGKSRRIFIWLSALLVLTAAAWGLAALFSRNPDKLRFQTVEVRRDDLTVHVTATGSLQPVNQVDVGTEISGTVASLEADFNDRVKRGQLLAKLNTDQLDARLRQSQAALELARAKVQDAQATLVETGSKHSRLQTLAAKGLASQDDLDAATAAFARATAGLEVAKDQVTQAQAQVDADRTTLDKAQIRSPIDGIVLKRQVEVGQTVAASLQTPVMFTLAENLAQMELDVAVDEADVGQVHKGQAASFSVDAFPGRSFPAVIDQVRFAPQTVQGVVTYETVLSVDNSDLALRPGMTATVEINVGEYKDVLLVPNAALRFSPPVTSNQASGGGSLLSRLFPRPSHRNGSAPRARTAAEGHGQRVWTLRNNQPVAIPIQVGATDGQMTQVVSGDVQVGTMLVVDVTRTPE